MLLTTAVPQALVSIFHYSAALEDIALIFGTPLCEKRFWMKDPETMPIRHCMVGNPIKETPPQPLIPEAPESFSYESRSTRPGPS